MATIRVGVDVGGTFTDVVAIDAQTRAVVASVKVPTTHRDPAGVATGIIEGIRRLLAEHEIDPADVSFIAHSTTQATNSLLEGDVARVGVLGLLDAFGWLSRAQIAFAPFELAPGAPFEPRFAFASASDDAAIGRSIEVLAKGGAEVVAVSQPFSVDRGEGEARATDASRERGLFATSGHEVSSMYGLRARTRTAALNAAILPKMVHTARMTADAVAHSAIAAPLMIMRSDGGVMDVREIERRPILTLLSGPAAGIAGALLHENVTDGIFIEVGGTSADCSAIRSGMPQMRPARVGGHRTMLRTLDVRTLAIAGGSMVRLGDRDVIDVGPRSAHIAGYGYASFSSLAMLEDARAQRVKPAAHDTADYAVLIAGDGTGIAITPTCAANFLGFVPADAFAAGDAAAAERAFEIIGASIGMDAHALATRVLDVATDKVLHAVRELVADYELDEGRIEIIGGGGGAAALVPYAAQRSSLRFRLARDAQVISPIGVALALVRDVVERTIVNPSAEDIVRIRRQAQDAVIAGGASPQSITVAVEIDPQRNLVRATASGASALSDHAGARPRTDEELLVIAANLLRAMIEDVERVPATAELTAFVARNARSSDWRVLDRTGVARLSLRNATLLDSTAGTAPADLEQAIEEQTAFGDVGRALPSVHVLHGARIADLSGLASAANVIALAREELSGLEPSARVAILTAKNRA